ncbi:MAG: hypothetical protein CMG64_05510 [Candidatus Marinimicrobia bacterium]|nr:hypothetical protein [Candidatus Neomarinimicrobiota bacterium]|tara:strand:- start:15517 stop:16632 length:1116 start_codon:yes stop_codon:yes gene_type:complete
MILEVFIICNFILYLLSLIYFLLGTFKKTNIKSLDIKNFSAGVSVILCVRNGEKSISNILNDFSKQIYDNDLEFIIVDDDSTDNTKLIIDKFIINNNNFRYIHSKSGNSFLNHKKRALDAGINAAKYEILLFTDVDCRLGNKWVATMALNFINKDYVIGYSGVRNHSSLVANFQKLDFLMLMISAFSSSNLGNALASSGQNQGYRKSLFFKVNGFNNISHLLQGDDSIFLNVCKKNKTVNVGFSDSLDSFVSSKSFKSWLDFFSQRVRWAGDANIMWKYNKPFFIIIISTFIANLFCLIFPIFTIIKFNMIIMLFALKFLLEFLLYKRATKIFNESFNLAEFIFWFIIQVPYVVLMGIFSFFQSQLKWKGR